LAADPVRRERFYAEVRITRQLSHPNICRVYDIAEVDGQLLVMRHGLRADKHL
jgi:serine/threonine protein kinase